MRLLTFQSFRYAYKNQSGSISLNMHVVYIFEKKV